ncbi:MAG TPA: PQQ-binding-like beta-propeller repeat protein, partial [Planctomycetota bacterium]|nr:PQQ-binding-like beta-propeller repeat protein [Planctomycetota bacterium]
LGEIRGLAFAEGTLYVWAGDACAAVDPVSGKVAWVSADAASRPVVHGAHVLVRTSKGLAALDRKTGRIASTVSDASGDPIVVGKLAAIPCGAVLRASEWVLKLSAPIVRLAPCKSGVAALGADGKLRIVALDGRLESEVALARRIDTAFVIDSGVLYGGSGNEIVAFDLSGKALWTYDAGARVTAPIVANGRVWFGTAAGRAFAVHTDR